MKKYLQPRYPNAAYIPDRFVIVVLSAILSWQFRWDQRGVDILGDIKTGSKPFPVHWPFEKSHLQYASDAFSTSFIIALLGFFESSVAAKSLGVSQSATSVIKNMNLSANRELVALGVANITGGLFMALPGFGGYGRSKVNASTGGKTPMSSIFLSIITVLCVMFMTPYFYYIPVSHSPLHSLSHILTNFGNPERRSLCYYIRSRLFPPRRITPRYPFLHSHSRLL